METNRDIEERYGDQIYRPGEDDINTLTTEERTERRKQVEEMFASGLDRFETNGDHE